MKKLIDYITVFPSEEEQKPFEPSTETSTDDEETKTDDQPSQADNSANAKTTTGWLRCNKFPFITNELFSTENEVLLDKFFEDDDSSDSELDEPAEPDEEDGEVKVESDPDDVENPEEKPEEVKD